MNETGICNLKDDAAPYNCDSNLKLVLGKLEHNSELAIAWFEMNYMKLSTAKYHLLISENKNEYKFAKLDQDIVWKSNNLELFGVTTHNDLKFDKYVSNNLFKSKRQLSVLKRVIKLFSFKKRLILFKAFVESQFKSYPLVWMFNGRQINDKKKNYMKEL